MNREQLTENKEIKKMNDTDGIIISDKPSWEHSFKELFAILGKRIISLPSKMIGFKPLCLFIATWLLVRGHIRDWIWFCVLVIVLFGIVGLKVVSKWKEH
jgi:formate hydrogenlyase subunit 3/multisubunit Na+/H+ antiporter MnhD subunit